MLLAFRHAEHERRLVAALRDALPDIPVAVSHELLPVFREYERASTTTVEAYLRPKVSAYLRTLEREVRARGIALLRVMTSRSEEHTSELQSQSNLVCRLLLEKKKTIPPRRPDH